LNVGKVLLLAKQAQVHAGKTRGQWRSQPKNLGGPKI